MFVRAQGLLVFGILRTIDLI